MQAFVDIVLYTNNSIAQKNKTCTLPTEYPMAHDVRAIANFVLKLAFDEDRQLTNLDVNKIVYFLHGWYLAHYDEPLVDAKIEAWQYGPVFRELYSEFRKFGDGPITEMATRIDVATASRITVEISLSDSETSFLGDLARKLSRIRTFRLVELSHVEGGPWDQVFNHREEVNPGMQITDDRIRAHFREQRRH